MEHEREFVRAARDVDGCDGLGGTARRLGLNVDDGDGELGDGRECGAELQARASELASGLRQLALLDGEATARIVERIRCLPSISSYSNDYYSSGCRYPPLRDMLAENGPRVVAERAHGARHPVLARAVGALRDVCGGALALPRAEVVRGGAQKEIVVETFRTAPVACGRFAVERGGFFLRQLHSQSMPSRRSASRSSSSPR